MAIVHANPCSRVDLACKALLRYVRSRKLKPGDRLPSQQELRSRMQFSNDTLTSAMKRLVASGMLVRRTGAGTTVADAAPTMIRSLWTIGLAVHPRGMRPGPFFNQLTQALQSQIISDGFDARLFAMREQMAAPPKLSDFADLPEAIANDRVDTIVTLPWLDPGDWHRLADEGRGICHVGPWEIAPSGVIIDQQDAVAWAVRRLVDAGCRRLATVSVNKPYPGFERFWIGFQRGLGSVGARASACEPVVGLVQGGFGGQRAAERLLAMPPERRPDGLVIVDDQLTMGLTATLVHSDYRPTIVTQSNRRADLSMSLPVFRFEVDVEAFAAAAAAFIHERLYEPEASPERRWYQPVPLEGPASIHPDRSAEQSVTL